MKALQKKILILTNFSENTNHARLNFEIQILKNSGYCVECFWGNSSRKSKVLIVFEKLLLKFINLDVLLLLLNKGKEYDFLFFYSVFTLNTLFFLPSSFRKRSIYQTLNHDIIYHTYELKIRIKEINPFLKVIKRIGLKIEYHLAKSCKGMIVNSKSLKEKFPFAKLIYYSSPLEGSIINRSPSNRYALIYLGQLRMEKISTDFFEFIESQSIMFFVYGKIKDSYIERKINSSKFCVYLGDFSSDELKTELFRLSTSWNLIGISLIQNTHESYEVQNANKDIDYMAMGIPVLGNRRETTREIIEEGNGFFYDEFKLSELTYNDYSKKSQSCLTNYKKFNNATFKEQFVTVFNQNQTDR